MLDLEHAEHRMCMGRSLKAHGGACGRMGFDTERARRGPTPQPTLKSSLNPNF